jgi:apolipoprotein D and lipocalin family protein
MKRFAGAFAALFTTLLTLGLAGCVTVPMSPDAPPNQLAANVDLDRYMGKWYIIANIPYFAENGKVASYFDIEREKGTGTLLDIYVGQDTFYSTPGTFTMRDYVVPDTGNARWRETPLALVYFSYLIVYVDPGYKTALVGYPGHELAWVMSREPRMNDAIYKSLLDRLNAAGYDAGKLRKVPQFPEQIGQPGFQ